MLRKMILGAAALTATAAALPAAAEAQVYGYDTRYARSYDGYDRGYYDRGYSDRRYYGRRYSDRGYYGRGYSDRGYYGRGYSDRGYYGRGYSDRGYYGRGYGYGEPVYHGRSRYRDRYARCGSGTTGTVIGGVAGALLGREIARGGGRYYGHRRGSGTTGAILGGAAGALIGREVGRSC